MLIIKANPQDQPPSHHQNVTQTDSYARWDPCKLLNKHTCMFYCISLYISIQVYLTTYQSPFIIYSHMFPIINFVAEKQKQK